MNGGADADVELMDGCGRDHDVVNRRRWRSHNDRELGVKILNEGAWRWKLGNRDKA